VAYRGFTHSMAVSALAPTPAPCALCHPSVPVCAWHIKTVYAFPMHPVDELNVMRHTQSSSHAAQFPHSHLCNRPTDCRCKPQRKDAAVHLPWAEGVQGALFSLVWVRAGGGVFLCHPCLHAALSVDCANRRASCMQPCPSLELDSCPCRWPTCPWCLAYPCPKSWSK